jgi:dipeptidyl-peptidase-3
MILPENTRIRKIDLSGSLVFEVLQASTEKDVVPPEFPLPSSNGIIRFIRGDHSEELTQICSSLDKASKYASNETQKDIISQYMDSFRTGSFHTYRNSQRTWIKDKMPKN